VRRLAITGVCFAAGLGVAALASGGGCGACPTPKKIDFAGTYVLQSASETTDTSYQLTVQPGATTATETFVRGGHSYVFTYTASPAN
jgi:hypothetical protein